MKNPMHISEVMHQLVLNNPNDPWTQILRHCPFIQLEMLKHGYMSLEEMNPDETDRLENCELDGKTLEEILKEEAQDD